MIKIVKDVVFEMLVMIDVVFDFYFIYGYDGIIENGVILNDEIVEVLVEMSFLYVKVGVDFVVFSDMMDGCILIICEVLEDEGFYDIGIMSYSVKYVLVFYGLFWDVLDSVFVN